MKIMWLFPILLLLALLACTSAREVYTPPAVHPPLFEMAEQRVYCVRCHGHGTETFDFARYDHTPFFTDSHRLVAYQDERICAMCHSTSFCNICHTVPSAELKPSDLYPTETTRRFHHRGDYVARHAIDARIDPGSCFRCHGNPRSAESCRRCHG